MNDRGAQIIEQHFADCFRQRVEQRADVIQAPGQKRLVGWNVKVERHLHEVSGWKNPRWIGSKPMVCRDLQMLRISVVQQVLVRIGVG